MFKPTMFKKVLSFATVSLTCLAATALAEPVSADGDAAREAARHVMGQYREQLVELERTARAAQAARQQLLGQLYAELERLAPPPTKSSTYCQQACSLLGTAYGQIGDAEGLAKSSWIGSCPASSNASDAFVFAHNSEYETGMVKNATCNTQSCDINDLRSARDLAFDAWIAADDAYSNDGCDADMQDASFEASDAWFNLHNAQYSCSRC